MGEGCQLQFSAYSAPIWTQFLPTTSQRWDATILLTFGGGDGPHRAGDDGVLWAKLGIVEWRLRWGSNSQNQSFDGGKPWGSSSRRQVGMGGGEVARRWHYLEFVLGFHKLQETQNWQLGLGYLLLVTSQPGLVQDRVWGSPFSHTWIRGDPNLLCRAPWHLPHRPHLSLKVCVKF
jgi:hypothetical protein